MKGIGNGGFFSFSFHESLFSALSRGEPSTQKGKLDGKILHIWHFPSLTPKSDLIRKMESEAKTVSRRWVVKFNIFLREGKGFLSRMHIPFLGRNTKDEELCCCCCCAQQRDEKPAKLNFRLRSFFLYPRGSNPACKDTEDSCIVGG